MLRLDLVKGQPEASGWEGELYSLGIDSAKDIGCGEDGLSGSIRLYPPTLVGTTGQPRHQGRVLGGVAHQCCGLGP